MRSQRVTQERLLTALMGAALLSLLAAIVWPSLAAGRKATSTSAIRNVRVLTASLEMYPLPAWSLPR
ncbi:MAG: hypothetical protein HY598_03735 [Candidatus Omnitrophica bacterium]|nr:hypothetical protein [Candidatus Omnitrophota bacterium]